MRNFMKSVLAGVVSMVAFGLLAKAADYSGLLQDCNQAQYYGTSSAATSTHSVTGIGLSYAVRSVGDNVSFTLHHTTKTLATTTINLGSGSYDRYVSSSPLITLSNGVPGNFEFRSVVKNPKIIIHNFSTSATAYIYIDYCEPKAR